MDRVRRDEQDGFQERNIIDGTGQGIKRVRARATALMPGTCGELAQGVRDGVSFHVTCPIDLFSRVTATISRTADVRGPADCPKSVAAVHGLLAYLDEIGQLPAIGLKTDRIGVQVEIESSLPRCKGMGSSTADVAGAIVATARALGASLDPATVARLALEVEPTDGTMFPGVVLFDHRRGLAYEYLGEPPPLEVVVLDFGGEVDTVAFNGVDRTAALRSIEARTSEALSLIRRGISDRCVKLIGQGATISALANQSILPNPNLPAVVELAREVGAVGVVVGHSGTIVGVLVDPSFRSAAEVIRIARSELPSLRWSRVCRLIGGGAR